MKDPLTRREALVRLGAFAAIPALPALRRLTGAPLAGLNRIGLAVITVRPLVQRDFARAMRQIAEIGYRDLDMYIHESRLAPRQTRAILDDVGLTCRSARVATPALYRGWDRSLDAANELGARWITLANVTYEERLSLRDWRELSEVFSGCGEAARKRGIGFCYHNHDFELRPMDGQSPLDLIVSATDPEIVKLQLDVYWVTKGGRDPVSEIRRLGSRVASLHLKDMDATAGRGITTVGTGTIDFAPILLTAQQAGVSDYFVEEDEPANPLEAARAAFGHLSTLQI